MRITAKTRSYSLSKGSSHYHREEGNCGHRITGPAWVSQNYFRVWYHEDHHSKFRENGPAMVYLSGQSSLYHIDGKPCSKETYENYYKNQKL